VSTDSATAKRALRRELLAARWAMTSADRDLAHHALRRHLRAAVARLRPATIAAYVPVGTEPLASGEAGQKQPGFDPAILPELLREAATQAGRIEPRILLPIWREDNELDWAAYKGVEALAVSPRGLVEPTDPRLDLDQIGQVDLVLLPALAVDGHGHRLGRGAGCYDRALARNRAITVAVTYDHERLDEVPHDSHDVPVGAVVTPSGLYRIQ
jgi:5-formyltetrahydrofolate cyclo-ligase